LPAGAGSDFAVLGGMAVLFLTLFMPWWEASLPIGLSVNAFSTRHLVYVILVDCLGVVAFLAWRLWSRQGPVVAAHPWLFVLTTGLAVLMAVIDLATPPILFHAAFGAYLGVISALVAFCGAVGSRLFGQAARALRWQSCGRCGSPLPPGAAYCPRCGQPP